MDELDLVVQGCGEDTAEDRLVEPDGGRGQALVLLVLHPDAYIARGNSITCAGLNQSVMCAYIEYVYPSPGRGLHHVMG